MNENFVVKEPIFQKIDDFFADIKKIQADMDTKIDAIIVKPYVPYKEDESCNILI